MEIYEAVSIFVYASKRRSQRAGSGKETFKNMALDHKHDEENMIDSIQKGIQSRLVDQ